MRVRSVLLLSATVLASPPASALETPDDTDPVACTALAGFRPGALATATAADRTRFAGKSASDCQALLYAVEDRRDVDGARRCCLAIGDCNRELAILFANGWGVPRDFDTATWFLCRAGDEMAPFELAGMLEQLAAMRTTKPPADLDYCAAVTSGTGMLFCAKLDYDQAAADWERRLTTLSASLGGEARTALAAWRTAAQAFSEEEGAWAASDSWGGSIYSGEALGAQQEIFTKLLATLERSLAHRVAPASAADLARVDRTLNEAYKKVMAAIDPASEPEAGRPQLREAQRAWIALRDRWQVLYRHRWQGAAPPDELERELATTLTGTRATDLLAGMPKR